MTVVLTDYFSPYATVTITANDITVNKKSTNQIKAVKGSNPVIVRLGKTTQVIMLARVYASIDIGKLEAWGGETVVVVSASSYSELPNDSKWLIKNLELKHKKGALDYRDVKFELEYYFTGAVI